MASAKATFIAILLAVAMFGAVAQREIPDFLHICNIKAIDTPKYEECVITSIEALQPYLKTGVPDYNIPSLEPLKLKRILFNLSGFRMQAQDILVHEASNFKINKLKIDFSNMDIYVDVALPILRVEGEYDANGKILLLSVHGSGPFYGNFSDCIGACKIKYEKYMDSNGVEKARITDFKMKITVGQGSTKFDNLFGGEQVLGDVINSAINNNFDLFMKEILPRLEKALSEAFQVISDNIVEQFSYAQLFPEA